MGNTAGHILKGSDVKLEGQFHIEAGQTSTSSENAISSPAQVRIVENKPEFAVMEVTCGCGAKTHIRCEYTDAQATEQEPEKKNNGSSPVAPAKQGENDNENESQ